MLGLPDASRLDIGGHRVSQATHIVSEKSAKSSTAIQELTDLVKDGVVDNHVLAYLPKEGRLTGLSKLARVIETLAKRPQLQERITKYAADIIMEELNPYGVIVVVEAEHMCMTMRGVKKPGSKTITSAVRGIFEKDIAARAEAMSLITMK